MKLTTDYERQKLAFGDKFGASTSRGECVCRAISTRIIEHGSLSLTVDDVLLLRSGNPLLPVNAACRHRILFSTILTLDKPQMLAALHIHGIWFDNLDESRRSLMHSAVGHRAVDCVQEILKLTRQESEKWAWILKKDKHGVSPLHLAAQLESPKILKLFLIELTNAKCDVFEEARDRDGRSPLHYAAAAGSLTPCELLLGIDRAPFPLDQRDRFGQTPLMYAVGCEYADEVIRLLAGKKIISITTRNKRGMTALHLAVIANNLAAIGVLLDQLCASATAFDHEQRTPLHYAALYGRVEAASALLSSGASNETRDVYNVTAAHYAAESDHFDVLHVILAASGFRDVLDSDNRTSFMWAVAAQCEWTVAGLLRMRCDQAFIIERQHKDKHEHSALHLAAFTGNKNICRMLADHDFDISARDAYNATPEHIAASEGHLDALNVFAFKRAGTVSPPLDVNGRSPFMYACLAGQAHVVRMLCEEQRASVRVCDVDDFGFTALHCAVVANSLQCVEVLLQNGFDALATDNDTKTPAQLAAEQKKWDIERFLNEHISSRTATTATRKSTSA